MAPKIPDRWMDYKPVGEKIEGTKFIAFKVPLKEHIARNVDIDKRLDRDILLKSVPNLGLIIDLTNTNRYYDPNVFKKEGVEYKKLMIPGHETPAQNLVDKFITIVKEFMKNNTNNDKLIGVHCTHGVNRTGYLICNYMISQMTIDPKEALNRFANARGHKIERNNYIDALHKLLETSNNETTTQVAIKISRSPHKSNNTRGSSIEKDKREYVPRSPHTSYNNNSRDRSIDRTKRYERNDVERTRDRNEDHSHRARRSPDNYRSRLNNNYNRKSRYPSPDFANNRRTNNNYYSYRPPAHNNYCRDDRSYYPKPPELQEQLRIPYNDMFYQQPPPLPPPRLRLDYYNNRPVDNRQPYNRQRYTYVSKTNNL